MNVSMIYHFTRCQVTVSSKFNHIQLHTSGRPDSAAASKAVVVAPAGGPAANLRSASAGRVSRRVPATAAANQQRAVAGGSGGSNAPAIVSTS